MTFTNLLAACHQRRCPSVCLHLEKKIQQFQIGPARAQTATARNMAGRGPASRPANILIPSSSARKPGGLHSGSEYTEIASAESRISPTPHP